MFQGEVYRRESSPLLNSAVRACNHHSVRSTNLSRQKQNRDQRLTVVYLSRSSNITRYKSNKCWELDCFTIWVLSRLLNLAKFSFTVISVSRIRNLAVRESLFKWVNLAIGKGLSQNDFVTLTFHRRSVLIRQHRHDGHLLWWVWTQHKISIVPRHRWHLNNSGFKSSKTYFKLASCQNKYLSILLPHIPGDSGRTTMKFEPCGFYLTINMQRVTHMQSHMFSKKTIDQRNMFVYFILIPWK